MSSGINLIDQLRDSGRGAEPFAGDIPSSDIKGSDENSDRPSTRLDQSERARLLLTVLFALIAFVGPQYYESTLQEKLVSKQTELQSIQLKVGQEQKKKQELASIREEMMEFDKRMEELRGKIKKVENLNSNRNLLVRSIDFLVTEMPHDIWLSKIEAKRGPSGSIVVEGYSKDLQTVSQFMKKLESAVFFPTWYLDETSHQEETKGETPNAGTITIPRDVKRFNIRAKLEEPVST